MRVLVTGHRGYIGAVMVNLLRHARFEVVGLDCDLYGDCSFGRTSDDTASFETDLRDIEFTDLLSFDAVVHLAALPESFGREIDPGIVEQVNLHGTLRLAECCKQAQVPRFLFASSCAVYGRNPGALQDENSPTNPLTAYARCKLECEQNLARLADSSFTPVFLRNPTVYGVSPQLRLDTVVNDFVASAVCRGRIDMQTEGRALRPFMHVEDVCRAYAAVLTAPDDAVASQVFNLACADQNTRIVELADLVTELVPGSVRADRPGVFDRRSYRVDGAKINRAIPGFAPRWTLDQGIRQLRDALTSAGLSPGVWRGERYRRVMRLQSLIEHRELDRSLHRLAVTPA